MSLRDKAIIVDNWDTSDLTEKVFTEFDVKESVLELKELFNDFTPGADRVPQEEICNSIDAIFGDFENE